MVNIKIVIYLELSRLILIVANRSIFKVLTNAKTLPKFCVKDKSKRKGRNPAKGEDMMLRARNCD